MDQPRDKSDGDPGFVDPRHVAELCPELRTLLEAELAAGNRISDTHKGSPTPDAIYVALAMPFKLAPEVLPRGVVFREVNDPHWWKAQYEHVPTRHLLVCHF